MDKVIVVGAGIAGLTAAYSLQKHGFDVQVIEASSRIGGRMITDSLDSYTIDCGAQFLSSAYPVLNTLIFELGLQNDFIATSPWTAIRRNKTIYRFRYDKIFSPATNGLLSWREWLKLGLKSAIFTPHYLSKHLNNFADWREFDTLNAADCYNINYGKWMTEYLIEPMLEGFYFQSPEETSFALPLAISGFFARRAKTMTLIHGIGSLPKALGSKLNIILNQKVNKIVVAPDEVCIRTDQHEYKSERVILAVPAHASREIYFSENQYEKDLLSTSYTSTINLAVGMAKEWAIPAVLKGVYGLLLPRKERKRIAALAFETAKHSGRSIGGHLINIMVDGKAGKEMMDWDDENIFRTLVQELDELFPGFLVNIVFHRLYRWKHAEPKSPVGRAKNIFDYRNQVSPNHKVLLAGDYMGMPFTEGAAETGLWAASCITKLK